jgi:hypothetical protein
MARLHYGPTLNVELDPEAARRVLEAIGAHATRGGWITFADRDAAEWSILVTPGIPIWLEPEPRPVQTDAPLSVGSAATAVAPA